MASAMTVTALNGVKVYNLAAGKKLPAWLPEQKRRALLKEDEGYARRIQLLQDFDFSTASQDIKMSSDGLYICACGVYPPQVKVYDVQDLGMKFERHMDAEVVAFDVLSEDWSKMVFLQVDRTLEFHAAYGRHYRTRVPKFGRCMAYYAPGAELLVGGAGDEVYRLNLEEGRFMAPYTSSAEGVNCMKLCPTSGLLMTGNDAGIVEMWDPRVRKAVASLPVGGDHAVSALAFDGTGLGAAVGTGDGQVHVYDLRASTPVTSKTHQYGLPIIDVAFHRSAVGSAEGGGETAAGGGGAHVVSADAKIIKVWNRHTGAIFTNIETPAAISRLCIVPEGSGAVGGAAASTRDSGLLLASGEQSRLQAYYVPALGVAPRWCAFLDALTEEMEEGAQGQGEARVYDDYKFITRDELLKLGMGHLVGSSLLRPYMHGFFIDVRLYKKVAAAVDPFAYDKWRKAKVAEKLAAKAGSRITPAASRVKVNADVAAAGASAATTDDRFAGMFSNPDMAVDTKSAEYAAHLEASGSAGGRRGRPAWQRAHDSDDEEEEEDVQSDEEALAAAGILAHADDGAGGPVSGRRGPAMYTVQDEGDVARGGSSTAATLLLGNKGRLRSKVKAASAAAAAKEVPLAQRLPAVQAALAEKEALRASTRGSKGGGREATFRAGRGRGRGRGGGGRGGGGRGGGRGGRGMKRPRA